MRWIAAALCAAAFASTGCEVCRWKQDCWADVIDDVSDHECELDCLYCPELDISRMGKPDWCQCPINAWLDWRQCSCNRPYCGPRNRWRDAQARSYYESLPGEPMQAAPIDSDLTLPPLPAAEPAHAR